MKRLLFAGIFICFLQLMAEMPMFWPISIGGQLFPKIEVACTQEQWKNGLMFRKELPLDGGMLFVFEKPEVHDFWMKNTLIPLDIIFLDSQGVVTALHTMKTEEPQGADETEFSYAMRLPHYSSNKPVIAAIELNAGMISELGLMSGDKIDLYLDALRQKANTKP